MFDRIVCRLLHRMHEDPATILARQTDVGADERVRDFLLRSTGACASCERHTGSVPYEDSVTASSNGRANRLG